MKALKEIMNLIYVGFSDRQFFVPQDLKFSSVIFLTIFTSISYKYVSISFFLLQTLFECLYPWLTQSLTQYARLASHWFPHFLWCMHLPLFLFFPPSKNKKTRLASNFMVTLYTSLSINQIGGGVCMLEDFSKL